MKCNHIAALRETLEQMDTRQLDTMLREELKKEAPDGELVRLLGRVLEEREKDRLPEIDDNIRAAWEQYQRKAQPTHRNPKLRNSRFVKAACLILVLTAFLMLLPQQASAKSFFGRILDWTESVFSLTSPGENQGRNTDYVFRTDNPGLQEIYDQVTELGVTTPVVPMWLPEGYELVECGTEHTPTKNYLSAVFSNGNGDIVYQIEIYYDVVTHDYYIENGETQTIEKDGRVYTLLHNQNWLIAVWTIENIECSILIDCSEDVLIRILESIYTMGGT